MQVNLVPSPASGHATYQVMDDLGKYGHVWSEIAENEANEQTVVAWIIEGQFKRPLLVIAFNADEGWSRNVTREVAWKILDLNHRGTQLSAEAREFVERITGENPVVAV